MKNLARILIALVLLLMTIGTGIIFSAKGHAFFISHLGKIVFAVFGFIFFAVIPYKYYRSISKYFLIGIILLLVYTLLFAPAVKGASRWLDIGIIRFQPSEVAKIFLLMHLAVMIEKKGDEIKDFNSGLKFMLLWIGAVCGLIFFQPNVSTTIIIALSSFMLLYVGGARFSHLFTIIGGLGLAAVAGAMIFPHSRDRIITFFNSLFEGGNVNLQVLQSKIALGSGGLFGLGIGHSRQSDLFLPEPHNDFVFSVLGEELGFIGALVILFSYMAIFFVGLLIAKKAKDNFGQLLAFGLSFTIVSSAFIHVAVGLGLLPTTGITLPFISFGGTSIIIFSISIGILINIAMGTNRHMELRRSRS
ncbi:MAG: FtsW/RodA/SpoVE family cell cycle protein [Melioribacteraceae bacterium]|nr:FtsW/RodA/SpoVE family cell cycle protein [Melioribacteraceae bacterium]